MGVDTSLPRGATEGASGERSLIGQTSSAGAPSTAGQPVAAEVQAPPPAPKQTTVEASNEQEARAKAAASLGVPAKELKLNVVSRQKKGLFGLGGEVLTVQATWTPPPPPPPSKPGRIEITCVRGKLSLSVFRPEGAGRLADVQVLEEMIQGWPLDARDESVISSALRAPDGRPRVFGTMAPSLKPDDTARAAIRVAKDELTAWLIPWNPEPLTTDALFALLGSAGIVSGVDEDLFSTLEGQVLSRPVVIARGHGPKNGVDAHPEFVFQSLAGDRDSKPAVREDGRVDFRETGAGPLSVQPGDILVRKVPLVPAENGFTVKGKTLPAKPAKDFDLKRLAGQNTTIDEHGTAILASAGGLAGRVSDKIVVMPIHTVDSDVDFKTGNVYFEGNLQIRGGVKPGFKVTATGS
ncbi:MAG TPA: FapA family protein, partial [Chloroflexota bacterium]|nr:FapA family protein [Chloroflexota bacterium]